MPCKATSAAGLARTIWGAHSHSPALERPPAAVPVLGSLIDELVECGVDVVRKLDLGYGGHALGGCAYGKAHNALRMSACCLVGARKRGGNGSADQRNKKEDARMLLPTDMLVHGLTRRGEREGVYVPEACNAQHISELPLLALADRPFA